MRTCSCSLTCVAKCVTSDPVRPAGAQAGLDRSADVVDVHVHVPETTATDHDERVTQLREPCRGGRDRCVIGVEEVHHFECERVTALLARLGQRRPIDDRRRQSSDALSRGGATAPGGDKRVEEYDETAPAGIDDTGIGERARVVLGVWLKRFSGGVGCCTGHGEQVAASRAPRPRPAPR